MHFENTDSDEEEKDLGVIFQKEFKFCSHIASKVNKTNNVLSLITRTLTLLNKTLSSSCIRH